MRRGGSVTYLRPSVASRWRKSAKILARSLPHCAASRRRISRISSVIGSTVILNLRQFVGRAYHGRPVAGLLTNPFDGEARRRISDVLEKVCQAISFTDRLPCGMAAPDESVCLLSVAISKSRRKCQTASSSSASLASQRPRPCKSTQRSPTAAISWPARISGAISDTACSAAYKSGRTLFSFITGLPRGAIEPDSADSVR